MVNFFAKSLVFLYKKKVYNLACFVTSFNFGKHYYAISNSTNLGPAMAYVMGDAMSAMAYVMGDTSKQ